MRCLVHCEVANFFVGHNKSYYSKLIIMEVLFAGCAAHSMAGRKSEVTKFDGISERFVSSPPLSTF